VAESRRKPSTKGPGRLPQERRPSEPGLIEPLDPLDPRVLRYQRSVPKRSTPVPGAAMLYIWSDGTSRSFPEPSLDHLGDESRLPSGCGAAGHCEKCDPFADARRRELAGFDPSDTIRADLETRIRTAAFNDVLPHKARQLAKKYAQHGIALSRDLQKVKRALTTVREIVCKARFADEPDVLLWLDELERQIEHRVGARSKASRGTAARYRRAAALPQHSSWTSDFVSAVTDCVQDASTRMGLKKVLAYQFVGLLMTEIGVFPRSKKPNAKRLGHRLEMRLSRPASLSARDEELIPAMIRLSQSTARAVADGLMSSARNAGLPPADSPGIPSTSKWTALVRRSRHPHPHRS